jgi:alcohol oxidase
VIAARIAAADENLSILVVEEGSNNFNKDVVVNPLFHIEHSINPDNKTITWLLGDPSPALDSKPSRLAKPNILGGGSSVNAMIYTRASACDYDAWDAPGWSAAELLPYLKKFETYHGPDPDNVHGTDGPIHISHGPWSAQRVEDELMEAWRKVGVEELPDVQNLKTGHGAQRYMKYIAPDGKRSDAAHCYLHPLLQEGRKNVHVLCETRIARVILDANRRATGAEMVSKSAPEQKKIVRARKLVVVSCGAILTPTVLERSGIGAANILEKAGVDVVVDLPGVGEQLQDHHLCAWPYYTSLESDETIDDILHVDGCRDQALSQGGPRLGWSAYDTTAKMRPSEAEVKQLGEAFERIWNRDFRSDPSRPLMITTPLNFTIKPWTPEPGRCISFLNYSAYPYGRGRVHITGPNVDDPLATFSGYLTGEEADFDVKAQIWAFKKGREVIRRTTFYRGDANFPVELGQSQGSTAAPVNSSGQSTVVHNPDEVVDLVYTAEDDKVIERAVRQRISTAYHSLCTAPMRPREKDGVVDYDLNVHGTSALKVCDNSIAPGQVGANTNNTALMIGEKAAAIILAELCLKDGILPARQV